MAWRANMPLHFVLNLPQEEQEEKKDELDEAVKKGLESLDLEATQKLFKTIKDGGTKASSDVDRLFGLIVEENIRLRKKIEAYETDLDIWRSGRINDAKELQKLRKDVKEAKAASETCYLSFAILDFELDMFGPKYFHDPLVSGRKACLDLRTLLKNMLPQDAAGQIVTIAAIVFLRKTKAFMQDLINEGMFKNEEDLEKWIHAFNSTHPFMYILTSSSPGEVTLQRQRAFAFTFFRFPACKRLLLGRWAFEPETLTRLYPPGSEKKKGGGGGGGGDGDKEEDDDDDDDEKDKEDKKEGAGGGGGDGGLTGKKAKKMREKVVFVRPYLGSWLPEALRNKTIRFQEVGGLIRTYPMRRGRGGMKKQLDFTKPLHQQSPPMCFKHHYLPSGCEDEACPHSHGYEMTDSVKRSIALHLKRTPCPRANVQARCPFQPHCFFGHICPNGDQCDPRRCEFGFAPHMHPQALPAAQPDLAVDDLDEEEPAVSLPLPRAAQAGIATPHPNAAARQQQAAKAAAQAQPPRPMQGALNLNLPTQPKPSNGQIPVNVSHPLGVQTSLQQRLNQQQHQQRLAQQQNLQQQQRAEQLRAQQQQQQPLQPPGGAHFDITQHPDYIPGVHPFPVDPVVPIVAPPVVSPSFVAPHPVVHPSVAQPAVVVQPEIEIPIAVTQGGGGQPGQPSLPGQGKRALRKKAEAEAAALAAAQLENAAAQEAHAVAAAGLDAAQMAADAALAQEMQHAAPLPSSSGMGGAQQPSMAEMEAALAAQVEALDDLLGVGDMPPNPPVVLQAASAPPPPLPPPQAAVVQLAPPSVDVPVKEPPSEPAKAPGQPGQPSAPGQGKKAKKKAAQAAEAADGGAVPAVVDDADPAAATLPADPPAEPAVAAKIATPPVVAAKAKFPPPKVATPPAPEPKAAAVVKSPPAKAAAKAASAAVPAPTKQPDPPVQAAEPVPPQPDVDLLEDQMGYEQEPISDEEFLEVRGILAMAYPGADDATLDAYAEGGYAQLQELGIDLQQLEAAAEAQAQAQAQAAQAQVKKGGGGGNKGKKK